MLQYNDHCIEITSVVVLVVESAVLGIIDDRHSGITDVLFISITVCISGTGGTC